jgi:hypothetical protein
MDHFEITQAMKSEIQSAIDNLVSTLQSFSHPETVSFSLFLNCEELEVKMESRSSLQLKRAGISMRNLKGDFIK